MKHTTLIEELNQFIADGKFEPVKKALLQINRKQVPREFLNQYSNLARRIGQFLLATKFINPLINTDSNSNITPTDQELLTYAACLAQLGASKEALTVINRVKNQNSPETVFKKCMALVSQWNYKDSIPLLEKLIRNGNLNDYQEVIAKLNLGAAQLAEGHIKEARNVLLEIKSKAKQKGYTLLLGTILEHLGKSYIYDNSYDEAEKYLNQSETILAETNTFYLFMTKKWLIINEILRANVLNSENIQKSEVLRRDAYERKYWMIIRDLDLYSALAEKDERKLTHVYYGSPFKLYRSDIENRLSKDFELPEFYDWRVGRTLDQTGLRVFDLQTAKEIGTEKKIKRGQLIHKLMTLLTTDFYRPFSIGTVFSHLYPDEKFDPFHSPDRIKKVINRFRKWANENEIPLDIQVESLEYRIVSTAPYVLRIPKKYEENLEYINDIEMLKNKHSGLYVNLPNAIKELNKSRKYVSELFKWAEKEGLIKRRGQASGTTYLVKSK